MIEILLTELVEVFLKSNSSTRLINNYLYIQSIDNNKISDKLEKVKDFDWSKEKNEKLKRERGISFQDVVDAIENGNLLKRISHPNQKKYPGQKIFIVKIKEYVYAVPFIESTTKTFFKTIYPSRKHTREYIKRKKR